ncbi:uncharacterized protein METZ01_LOCUS277989, partial [marine metagenome]
MDEALAYMVVFFESIRPATPDNWSIF